MMIDLEFNVSIYINCITSLFNSLFSYKLTVGALRTDLSEFQGQNFKVGGTLGAELVCFCIQVLGDRGFVRDHLRSLSQNKTHICATEAL